MPRQDAFYQQYALFIHAALIACHANQSNQGFRQKDFKIYVELLSNWMETSFQGAGIEVQNTQIQRLLDSLVAEGLLKKVVRKKIPFYFFTSIGLLEIVTRLVSYDSQFNLQNFFFLFHFVSLYSGKMENLLIGEKDFLPKSYQLEIKHLLNPKNLVDKQKQSLQLEMSKLKDRIDEAYKMTDLAQKYLKADLPLSQVIAKVEAKYPYQLNNQKRMSEMFRELSPDVQLIEISEAPKFRAETLWEPLLLNYLHYMKVLNTL